ncbi:MAG: molecular chaperone DnaJ [Polyangiaceae bacterium]
MPDASVCGVCGGDGRIDNAFGQTGRCPSCHGTGRPFEDTGFRDVTKTKASHHGPTNRTAVVEKTKWPVTLDGGKLADAVKASSAPDATKAKLVQDIIDHEATHGHCTKTFMKKVQKQIGPARA